MLVTLQNVGPADESNVGGKALNCARLRRAGFPVPDGLIVTADTRPADVDGIVDHAWFRTWPVDQRFAVRSSGVGEDAAGHSFAGIHETFLNVERSDIVSAVRACLASTVSEQARAYRASHGLADEARAAVLIQPMIDAVISGVAFTVHPVSGAEELVIDAAPGLGEALVSGRIEPDHYRLRKADGSLVERTVLDGRPPLSDSTVRQLAGALLRVEEHFGIPQDVEWAVDDEQLWLLQSRPITTARASLDVPSSSAGHPDRRPTGE
ncbi:MAG: phosphoenolpyruvate synthase, partial [Acidimicrobiia bacterium]|nr:phosphoenolpyruvate synthase [Acidimicrobiia bacterium]